MSISNSQMVRDALGLIRVLGEVESASAEQAALGIRVMNDIMASWIEDGIDLQYYEQTDPGAETPIPANMQGVVKYFLAFTLAPYFDKQVTQEMLTEARRLYGTLVRNSITEKMKPIKTTLPRGEGQLCLGGLNRILTG